MRQSEDVGNICRNKYGDRKVDTKQMIFDRYYYPIKVLAEMRELGISPLTMSENYILHGIEQINEFKDAETKKKFVSILVDCSIRRVRTKDSHNNLNGVSNHKLLKMDPLDNNEYYCSELLHESLIKYFKKMIGSEIDIIKTLSDQMNQYLKMSSANNIDELINARRISEILSNENSNNYMENFILSNAENNNNNAMCDSFLNSKIFDSKIINFPFILLRLRESIIRKTLNNLKNLIVSREDVSLNNGLIKTSYSLFNYKSGNLYYDQNRKRDTLFNLKKDILCTKNSELELIILMEYINNCLTSSKDNIFELSKDSYELFEYKYSNMLKYLNKRLSIEQINAIVDLSLRTFIKSHNVTFLLLLIDELSNLKKYIDNDFELSIEDYIWSKLQLLSLKSHLELYVIHEEKKESDSNDQEKYYCDMNDNVKFLFKKLNLRNYIDIPLFKYAYLSGFPLYGCNILQFSLVSDPRIFNNVIKEGHTRSRIEVLLTQKDLHFSDFYVDKINATTKFDTRRKGGLNLKIPYSLFTIEFCDNIIYVYINSNCYYNSKSNSGDHCVKKVLQNYYYGDYIIEFVCFTSMNRGNTFRTYLSIYINGEFVFKYYFCKELYDTFTLYQRLSVSFQITMTEGVHMEMNNESNYSNNLVNSTLVNNNIIDAVTSVIDKDKLSYISVSLNELLLFLSSILRRIVGKDPENILVNKNEMCEANNMNTLYLLHKIISNEIVRYKNNSSLKVYDISLLVNLTLMLKYVFSGGNNNNLILDLIINKCNQNSTIMDDYFQLILKLLKINIGNEHFNYEWLIKKTAINVLSQMNSILLTYIFYTTRIDNIVEFIDILMDIQSSVTNEVVELFKHFLRNDTFNLLITRLLKNRDYNTNIELFSEHENQHTSSHYFMLLGKMLKVYMNEDKRDSESIEFLFKKIRNNSKEHSTTSNYCVSLFSYLTEKLINQIEYERKRNENSLWIYREYDLFKLKDNSENSQNTAVNGSIPLYHFYFNKNITLNILLNIFVMCGMTISQNNIVFFVLDDFDKHIFNSNNLKKKKCLNRIGNLNFDRDFSINNKSSDEIKGIKRRIRRYSSSMYIGEDNLDNITNEQLENGVLDKNKNQDSNNEINDTGEHPSEEDDEHDLCYMEKKDFIELNKNIIFWNEIMYEIFKILLLHSKHWLESNNILSNSMFIKSNNEYDLEDEFNKIKNITDGIYKLTSGMYNNSNIIWFGYFLKYGITECLGNIVSFTINSLKFFRKDIEFRYNFDLSRKKIKRIEKKVKFSMQEAIFRLNVRVIRDIMAFNDIFSYFSKEIIDNDIIAYKVFSDNLHPVIEAHILFNWLHSQLLLWSYIDVSRLLKDYLLFSLGEHDLKKLKEIHPIIYTDVIENNLIYKTVNDYKIVDNNLVSENSDWISNLILIINKESSGMSETTKYIKESREFVEKVMSYDSQTVSSLGRHWKNFHPKYKNVQLAIYSVILHLFGVGNLVEIDDKKRYILDLSLDISIKSCSQILSNIQSQLINVDTNDEADLHMQNKNREFIIESTINRCRWIIDNIPFNLFNDFYKNSFNLGACSERDSDSITNIGDSNNNESNNSKRNRRATDTNITFNKFNGKNHINMIKQLLNIRRKSSQYSIDNSSVPVNSVATSSSSIENRNYSDPSVLTALNSNMVNNESNNGIFEQRIVDINDVLNVYINFILNGPKSMSSYNKLIKSELLSVLMKLMAVEFVHNITNFNMDYRISFQSYLKYEGWIYIRMLHLFILNEFNFKKLPETEGVAEANLKNSVYSNKDNNKYFSENHVNLKLNSEFEIRPYFNLNIKNLNGIVNNIKKWLISVDCNKISEDDEFWFDSSLRAIVLYSIFILRNNQETFILQQLSKYIFPFSNKIENCRDTVNKIDFVMVENSDNCYSNNNGKHNLKDSVTGVIIADVISDNYPSIVKSLKEQGYNLEQVIENELQINGKDKNDNKIYLFVQRLSSLPVYSISVKSNSRAFRTYYNVKLNKVDTLFILRPNEEKDGSQCFSSESISYSETSSDSNACKLGDNGNLLYLYSDVYIKLFKRKIDITKELFVEEKNKVYCLECILPLSQREGSFNSEIIIEEMENALMEALDFDDLGAINLKANIYSEVNSFNFVCLYSNKSRISDILSVRNTFSMKNTIGHKNKIINEKVIDFDTRKKIEYIKKATKQKKLPFFISSKSSISPSSSLSSSASFNSSSIEAFKKINSQVLSNSYIIRLKKRGWIIFKSYIMAILVSKDNDFSVKEKIINYIFNLLWLISNQIKSVSDDNIEELEFCVEDTINILIYTIQLTCYSTKLKSICGKTTKNSLVNIYCEEGENGQNLNQDENVKSNMKNEISYIILLKFLRFHDNNRHFLSELWSKNSLIESKISVLLTECIRQCTLAELMTCGGINSGQGDILLKDSRKLINKNSLNNFKMKTLSISLPDLHVFPNIFLKMISSELLDFAQGADNLSPGGTSSDNTINTKSEDSSGNNQNNTGSMYNNNSSSTNIITGGVSGTGNNSSTGGNEISLAFRNHPHSSTFIGALPSENFNVNIDGRIAQCDLATLGGGIVICRAPLTFRGLQSTGLSIPPNILSFRVLGQGRFGITVAPSNVLTMSLEEVFQRNDVVGLKPQIPSGMDNRSRNNSIYQLPENMFALEITYLEGTVIDIRYGVTTNSSGSILRSEIFIGGESIGSVLEVQFNELAQISEETRLSVIFVVLDPLTILYEGLPFSTRYRRRSSTLFETIQGVNISNELRMQNQDSSSPKSNIDLCKELDCVNNLKHKYNLDYVKYIQNIKLFQEILISNHDIVSSIKNDIIESIYNRFSEISEDYSKNLDNYYKINGDKSIDMIYNDGFKQFDDNINSNNLLDSLTEKTLFLCSICTIFGVDINPLEEDSSADIFNINGSVEIDKNSINLSNITKKKNEKELFLRRRCSNIAQGDLPWLSSSVDSGVLCYTCLYGLDIKHLEMLLQGYFKLFSVEFVNKLYFLLGFENVKINNNDCKISQSQKQLLESISVLISRSSLVISLITRVILELSPSFYAYRNKCIMSEKLIDTLYSLFCLMSNFSLYSCGEENVSLSNSLFDIFSYSHNKDVCNIEKKMEKDDEKNLMNIISSIGVEFNEKSIAKRKYYCGIDGVKGVRRESSTYEKYENEIEDSDNCYDSIYICNSIPTIELKTILLPKDCNILWRWLSEQDFISNANQSDADKFIGSIKHLDNSIYGKLSMNQRIFNLEGSNPITAKALVLKSNGTMAIWSIKISAIDIICNICGIIPEEIISRLFIDKDNVTLFSHKFFQLIKIMRICTYFIIRGREDFVFPAAHQILEDNNHLSPSPDYWLMYRRSLNNDINNHSDIIMKDSTEYILSKIDYESVLIDRLYSWQRIMYSSASRLFVEGVDSNNLDKVLGNVVMKHLKTEITFHLVGSLIQIFSIRKIDNSHNNINSKQQKYSSLSPSVYVAHWLMDQFIRHPLCPSMIRKSIVNNLTWNSLFSLITNGVHIPTKLAIDSCRMTYWITNSFSDSTANECDLVTNIHCDCGTLKRSIKPVTVKEKDSKSDQIQGILDSICYCVSCILSLYESKVPFDNDNTLVNINNLPVFRELILGKVPITHLGWDHFTSAEDYKPINRQRINATLVCHFMACSARCILDSSDEYTILPLPHILSFFNKYLSFISISNHLMLSTSDTITNSSDFNIKRRNSENEIKPNTLFPWKYIQNALNYLNTGNMLIKHENGIMNKEHYSLLRINYGISTESIILDKYKRNMNSCGYYNQYYSHNNSNNSYLANSLRKNSGFIGFKLKPVGLEHLFNINKYDKEQGFEFLLNNLPRVIYSISEISGPIYEFGGYEFGLVACKLEELVKSSNNGSKRISINDYQYKFNILGKCSENIDRHEHGVNLLDESDGNYNIYNIRLDNLLYVNGLHTSNVNINIVFSKQPSSFKKYPIKHLFIGGIVFDKKLDHEEISKFYNIWINNDLINKLRLRKSCNSNGNACVSDLYFSSNQNNDCCYENKNNLNNIYNKEYGYLGTIIYSYYDDRCLSFGDESIKNSLTRIRTSLECEVESRFKCTQIDMNIIFQNRLLTFEINNTPISITGLPPESRFMLPVVCINKNKEFYDDCQALECFIHVKNSLNDVFIPYTQVISKVEYLPTIQSKKNLPGNGCENIKWIPNEFVHQFNNSSNNEDSVGVHSSLSIRVKGKERGTTSLRSLVENSTRIMKDSEFDSSKGISGDIVHMENSNSNPVSSSINDSDNFGYHYSPNGVSGSTVSVLGYLHPCIPSGIGLCSSNNTRKELYNYVLFNNWSNSVLPSNSNWFVVDKSEGGEELFVFLDGSFKRKVINAASTPLSLSSGDNHLVKNGEIQSYLNEDNYSSDNYEDSEVPTRQRIFKNLTPCKSFSVTFNIVSQRNGDLENDRIFADSNVYGVGIDWLNGLFRYVWLSDGRLVVPLVPPLPYELSKLNKEYKIPVNREIVIHNNLFRNINGDEMISIESYGVNDEITIEFQPNIPAILFFKNRCYCFSFNFTEFYKNIGSYYIADTFGPFGVNCSLLNHKFNENTSFESKILSEKQIWILRTLVIMCILEDDSYILDKLVSKYTKYLIDLDKGEFLFKVLISDDLYNNILNCIPKSVFNSKSSSLRSLLNNIYDYVKFPNTREYCLINVNTTENEIKSHTNMKKCTGEDKDNEHDFSGESRDTFEHELFELNWDLLEKVFSINTKDEIDNLPSSTKEFCDKRSKKIVKHETPFWLACWIGCEDTVKCLLKYVNVNNTGTNLENYTKTIIQDTKNRTKSATSLYIGCHNACFGGSDNSSSNESLSYNIQVNWESFENNGTSTCESLLQTGIMGSVISGNARMVYILTCIYDSDVNIQDKQGNTCYHFAIAYGNLNIIQLLTYKGVNPFITNKQEQFAGSLYRNQYKNYMERNYRKQCSSVITEHDINISRKYDNNSANFGYDSESKDEQCIIDNNFELSFEEEFNTNFSEIYNTENSKTNEWYMTPKPPKLSLHVEKSEIVEFTQQYEKIYCFSVYNNNIKNNTTESCSKFSYISLNINNKSNLLPPYQYPWPGLFSDCQIISVIDNSLYKNAILSSNDNSSSRFKNENICIQVKSLEIGGIFDCSDLNECISGNVRTEKNSDSKITSFNCFEKNSQAFNLVKRLYDSKKVNIHIIQYLFYRWLKSIKSFGTARPTGVNACSFLSTTNRRPDTGRPIDDLVFNINTSNYYLNTTEVGGSAYGSNTIGSSDQQGNNNTPIHHQFLHRVSGGNGSNNGIINDMLARSSEERNNMQGRGVRERREREMEETNEENEDSGRNNSGLNNNILETITGSNRGLNIYRGSTVRNTNCYFLSPTQTLAQTPQSSYPFASSGKILLKQEVIEEIYKGLSQVKNVRQILDIIHVIYNYIGQLVLLRTSMGVTASHKISEIVFPKNAGMVSNEGDPSSPSPTGTLKNRNSDSDLQSENKTMNDAIKGQLPGNEDEGIQELMIRSCWELLEMEEIIDDKQGYYPYWTNENERYIWIHNVRKLLSLVKNDYNNLDYISCNSWIEWIPNLDLFDKSVFNKYKKTLLQKNNTGNKDYSASKTSNVHLQELTEIVPNIGYEFSVKPVISVDMKILQRMHQYCQNIIDQMLIKLMNIELTENGIFKVLLYELLNQISFYDKKEYEICHVNGKNFELSDFDIRAKTLMVMGIKSTDISKLLPKSTSSIWNKTKISFSDSVDMIRFISNSIKNLIVSVILKYNFNNQDEFNLLNISNNSIDEYFGIEDSKCNFCEENRNCLKGKSIIDLNNLHYEDSEFPFRVIEILINKTLPIYTTSIDIFTKIQTNCSSNYNLNNVRLRIQSLCWYADILQQFIYGRILLLNKFNELSRYTIPMISGVYNSPTLNYEQEDFLRISSSYYFINNYYGDLFWRLQNYQHGVQANISKIEKYDQCFNAHSNNIFDPSSDMNKRDGNKMVMSIPHLLLKSSKLLGTWGGYHNIYSSPRYLIHIGPYDIPIPISSYLLLKPFYKQNLVNALWGDIIRRVIDFKKRDNGNTTANNGLTVHLNRNLAVNGNNPLKFSLLSQSTRQILQMLPEKLRISERPFLIVFRGEGSTDFGGPFQEFLSWISNEIMSKNNDNLDERNHHLGNSMQYNGLFIPCANALHSIGHNQDTVTINSIYSNYKTMESLYTCEDFLLFNNMTNTSYFDKKINFGIFMLNDEKMTLLNKFKCEYYKKRSLSKETNFLFNDKKGESNIGLFVSEFTNIINKIPSLRCHHNYSNNENILTTTINFNLNHYIEKNKTVLESNCGFNNDKLHSFDALGEYFNDAHSSYSSDTDKKNCEYNNIDSEYDNCYSEEDSAEEYYYYEYEQEEEDEQLFLNGEIERETDLIDNTSSSISSLNSMSTEMDNNEITNNTNLTPIMNSEANTQREHNIDDMGIIHKLDPWEWPKDKDMREIINEMYECLGRLMGICITTKSALNINLNPLIWKKFSGLPLSLKDLVDADCIAYEMLNSLKSIQYEQINNKQRNVNNDSNDENIITVPEIEGLTFQIENMNGNIISLLNNEDGVSIYNDYGKTTNSNTNVNLNNLHLFIQLAERCRMIDDSNIMINILKGFGTIIPLGRMRMLFNYQKIEYLICGESKIDLNILKNHTVSPHPELKEQLFKVLETFNNEQLQKLLRFVSGRSRLPQTNSSNDWKFSINYDNPDIIQDNRLPIATTCGFRLSLPRYSNIEILRSRLLYAINNCVAIDLDAYVIHDN